ncbi:MAG: class I SAM-dependent methyltransferase [Thermoguttaceae bacterium]|jgi:SAM-dependent methyltransferase
MTANPTPSEAWESLYRQGKFPRCPYDHVASFVFRNAPQHPRNEVRILELGCGPGNNLALLVQEGFACSGIDSSPAAIEYARNRIGPAADLRVASFPGLPFSTAAFELALERAALSYVSFDCAVETIAEVRRVLIPGGRFLFNPYSEHAENPCEATYYDRGMVEKALDGWRIISLQKAVVRDELAGRTLWGEWRAWAATNDS